MPINRRLRPHDPEAKGVLGHIGPHCRRPDLQIFVLIPTTLPVEGTTRSLPSTLLLAVSACSKAAALEASS